MSGWYAVDLDGTLAEYDGNWKGPDHIGKPIPLMALRVSQWLAEGKDVRIFTARAAPPNNETAIEHIQDWTQKFFGVRLPVTATKDFGMIELWDDRCVQIKMNTGLRMDGQP